MNRRKTLLILSFSEIASDARLLKQIRLFAEDYEIVTCGFGPKPEGVSEHVAVPVEEPKRTVLFRAACIRLHLYRLAYAITPMVRAAKRGLRGRRFDAVLANDLDTAGVAVALDSGGVHLDLHEYWPGRQDQNPAWVQVRKPYYEWQLRTYARRARSVTTVSDTIAKRYRDEFGIDAGVVTNASPFREFQPQPVSEPLRLVHSGVSLQNRKLEELMRGVAASSRGATLDLYLMGAGTPYHQSLVDLADELGERIRLLPPVPHDRLVSTLNRYDVGLHVLPPTNTNNALALPNKFFDYVQARLCVVIGPTASMAELLERHDLGAVTADFTADSLARVLDDLDADRVRHHKQRSHESARPLSAEEQNRGWQVAVDAISGRQVKTDD